MWKKDRILRPWVTNGSGCFCSCLLQPRLTRCFRRYLSSGYYEFTSYKIGHPESSLYARNMEILQRRTNCGTRNVKGTQESFQHFRTHFASHLILNAALSYKHPEAEQTEYSQPFPGHIFPVSGIQCPDHIHIKLPSHDQCSSFVWSSSKLILWQ